MTLQDIANHCGVSIYSVSRALNNKSGISIATAARIRAAAEELGYDPMRHEAARRLALQKHGRDILNRVVTLFFPISFYKANYFADIFRGLMEGLMSAGFGLLTLHLEECTSGQADVSLPPTFSRGDVDGAVVCAGPESFTALEQTLRATPGFGQRPILSVIWHTDGHPAVLTDDRHGAYLSARHLLDLGHRHLVHLTVPNFGEKLDRRLQGIQHAFEEQGLDFASHVHLFEVPYGWLDPEVLTIITKGNTVAPGEDALVDYLRAHPEVTAILGLNDPSAIQAWYTLQAAGMRVPEDISIIGFDDTETMTDTQGNNLLTTVRLPLLEVGQRAAELIIAQVTTSDPQPTQLMLPTDLVVRQSTATPCR